GGARGRAEFQNDRHRSSLAPEIVERRRQPGNYSAVNCAIAAHPYARTHLQVRHTGLAGSKICTHGDNSKPHAPLWVHCGMKRLQCLQEATPMELEGVGVTRPKPSTCQVRLKFGKQAYLVVELKRGEDAQDVVPKLRELAAQIAER